MRSGNNLHKFSFGKFLRKFLDEFVYGGHFLAIGDSIAMLSMALVLNIPITWSFLVVVYLCVFSANLFNRSDESEVDELTNPVRVKIMNKYVKNFYWISVFCIGISVALILFYSNLWALFFAATIFLLAILYTSVFKNLTKYIVGFKSMIAAFYYALVVILMAIYYSMPIDLAVILIFLFYYSRIFISNAVCDVKDIDGDRKRGLRTIAIALGEKGAMRFLNLFNILSGLILVFGILVGVLPLLALSLLLTIPYTSYYLYLNSKIDAKEMYTNAIVDGEFIFWILFVSIGMVVLP